jgi:hypothetical protein
LENGKALLFISNNCLMFRWQAYQQKGVYSGSRQTKKED